MAMRIYTPDEFAQALRDAGFIRSYHRIENHEMWHNADLEPVLVPTGCANYPDYILDRLLRYAGNTEQHADNEKIQLAYAVNEAPQVLPFKPK